MIAGHFAFAAAVKAREPKIPLWSLMLSTQWLDVAFVPLLLAGIETFESAAPDAGHSAPLIHADYTHSLVGALILSAIFGGIAARLWGQRAGIVLGAVSMSHWVIDLIVHQPDMPILPGNLGGLPLLGFGLWTWPAGAIVVEALVVSSVLASIGARPSGRRGRSARRWVTRKRLALWRSSQACLC